MQNSCTPIESLLQVPFVHEQRPDRPDRAAHPDAQPPLPHDRLHAPQHRGLLVKVNK